MLLGALVTRVGYQKQERKRDTALCFAVFGALVGTHLKKKHMYFKGLNRQNLGE